MTIMSLLRFLLVLGIGTLMSWGSWWLVVSMMSPTTDGGVALLLFYSSFWLAMFGTATLIGFFIRYWLEKDHVLFRQIGIAFRHGTIVSSGVTLALLLQSRRLLNIWAIVALLALAVVIELFFLAGQTVRPATTASDRYHAPT
jgi:Na+/melibiose symporter-like transporter